MSYQCLLLPDVFVGLGSELHIWVNFRADMNTLKDIGTFSPMAYHSSIFSLFLESLCSLSPFCAYKEEAKVCISLDTKGTLYSVVCQSVRHWRTFPFVKNRSSKRSYLYLYQSRYWRKEYLGR